MGIFGSIMDKIFNHPSALARSAETVVGQAVGIAPPATPAAATTPQPAQPVAPAATPAPAKQQVDVGAVLTTIAAEKGGGGNWQTSIVDLLKLLDLDSSLNARKELARELNVHVGADGTSEENMALHAAVMEKLAENGGKMPDSLRR